MSEVFKFQKTHLGKVLAYTICCFSDLQKSRFLKLYFGNFRMKIFEILWIWCIYLRNNRWLKVSLNPLSNVNQQLIKKVTSRFIADIFFPSTDFLPKAKTKRMVRNDVFGGLGRWVHGFSVSPWHGGRYKSNVTLAKLCSYPTRNDIALISTFLTIRAMQRAAQELINL